MGYILMDGTMDGFKIFLRRKNLVDRSIDQHCRRLAKILPYSHISFTRYISSLSAPNANKFMQTAKHWCDYQKISYDKSTFSRLTEKPALKPTLSKEEIDAFLALPSTIYSREPEKTHKRWTTFWTILCWTSARPGEVAQLRGIDCDFASNCFIFPRTKTGTGRAVAMHPLIRDQIEEYVNGSQNYLFTYKDKPFSPNGWLKDFNLRKKALGITKDIEPYCIRHSFISGSLNNEANLLDVQDIAGHKSPKTTRIYRRGNIQAQIKAMNHYPFIRDKLGLTAAKDTWNKLRTELLEAGIEPLRVTKLETSFYETINVFLTKIDP